MKLQLGWIGAEVQPALRPPAGGWRACAGVSHVSGLRSRRMDRRRPLSGLLLFLPSPLLTPTPFSFLLLSPQQQSPRRSRSSAFLNVPDFLCALLVQQWPPPASRAPSRPSSRPPQSAQRAQSLSSRHPSSRDPSVLSLPPRAPSKQPANLAHPRAEQHHPYHYNQSSRTPSHFHLSRRRG